MSTSSPALLHKIAMARANAPSDLPLVRNSAYVVLAWVACGGELDAAIANLKASHGSNWSLTTALQLLSGRRGQFAAECGTEGERAMLYLAHLVAKSACCQGGLGAVTMPTQAEMQELRAHIVQVSGESYRLKDKRKSGQTARRTTAAA